MTSVDIYNNPSRTLNADLALELAFDHGVRDTVLKLLPYTVFGPDYDRGVHENLRTALRMFLNDRGDEGHRWLGEATRWAARQGLADG